MIAFCACPCPAADQTQMLRGEIRDASSRRPLPAANIQVTGTPFGAITNSDGSFQLSITPPVKIRCSYIGYNSQTITVESVSDEKLAIMLLPAVIDMGQVTISAKNPAVQIMEKVLAHKQTMREKIHSFRAQAYHRLNVQNDSAVVMIIENVSRLYWQAGRGSREIFGQLTQTSNLPTLRQGVGVSDIPNFYDDDILIGLYRFVGPTHPQVFDFYDFSLTGHHAMDGRIIYEIHLTPKNRIQPLFEGDLSIQDSSFALIAVDLASAKLPRQNLVQNYQVTLKQQFREVSPSVWLPADWHEKGSITVGMTGLQFPTIHYVRLASLDDFVINIPVPDSLFRLERRLAPHDSALIFKERGVPLSFEEQRAYESIDSTMTLMQAFKPRGILAKMVQFDVRANDQSLSKSDSTHAKPRWQFQHQPMVWFNRVEAFHLGWSGRTSRGPWALHSGAAYRTGPKRWAYLAEMAYETSWGGMEIAYSERTQPIAAVDYYPLLINSLPVLFGYRDYYDYYQARGWRWSLELTDRKRELTGKISLLREKHASLSKTSDFDLVRNEIPQRANPAISAGSLAAMGLRFDWRQADPSLAGGTTGMCFEYEQGLEDFIQGEFSYSLYRIKASARLRTFLRRQPVPAAFDFHLIAGTASGKVPLQKSAGLPGCLGAWSPFGAFHTLRGASLYADQYAALFWEHNFRAWPFDILGWRYPGEKGLNLLLHGGHGRIWAGRSSPREQNYHEAGLSLSGLFSYLRMDVSRRLGHSGFWCVGLNVAKFI